MLRDYFYPATCPLNLGGQEKRVRFSLNALLCLEMTFRPLGEILETPAEQWDMQTVCQLVRAACCSLPENHAAVAHWDFDAVQPDLADIGEMITPDCLPRLRRELAEAILSALPPPSPEAEDSGAAMNEGHLLALCVDVMGIPQTELQAMTHREIRSRVEHWEEIKGLKKPAVRVKEYED